MTMRRLWACVHLTKNYELSCIRRTVVEIRGNDNLQELWPPPADGTKGGLQIVSEGLVHFILNRYLCPKKITDLVKTGALVLPGGRNFRTEELELAEATNGKLGFCESRFYFMLSLLLLFVLPRHLRRDFHCFHFYKSRKTATYMTICFESR